MSRSRRNAFRVPLITLVAVAVAALALLGCSRHAWSCWRGMDQGLQRRERFEASGLQESMQAVHHSDPDRSQQTESERSWLSQIAAAAMVVVLAVSGVLTSSPAYADKALESSKMMLGGASSSGKNSGTSKNITRGMDLIGADYSNRSVMGVSFQQSIVRDAKFVNSNCENAGFFDADLANTDFTGARLNQANFELARLSGAILDNAIATEMFVNGTTKMDVKSIDGADFTDTVFRKDQLNYLCNIAKGVNPVTKVSTRESLGCPE
eukprot:gb/GFBE01068676.1/.p1 GENE.gb/GFBE01068676.1/~~gb/GFBE01068676.1/.p1  ORF type:complete len:266 (+),score=32.84 gb/GFBE01068676.1/:1-798(+)